MRLVITCLLLIAVIDCFSQKPYDIKLIQDSLLKGADVVKRVDETVFKVKALDKVVEYHKVAYTILNEAADNFGYMVKYYDKLNEINTFDATLFDADGNKVRSVKRSEVKDESAVSGISLMEDNRVKWFNFFRKDYPYTVEFITETEARSNIAFPTWVPVSAERMGVVQSSFKAYIANGFTMRYKLLGGAPTAKKEIIQNDTVYSWQVQNIAPVKKESYSVSWYEVSPTVLMAPGKFQLQNYEGDMNTWESFGMFFKNLNAGRDELPEKVKAEVHRLADPLTTEKEKINVLYKYLQDNTRYISVQLGIGGLQPFDANYVTAKKYGDCKALSNYMTALLKEAGVTSFYAIIKAGDNPNSRWMQTDFVKDYFNHIIVCAPNKGDTIWLECTSQRQYPGYMSDFTDNRYAFLVTPEGGKIVKTPKYTLNENTQVRKLNGKIDEEGHMKVSVNTAYQAQQQDLWFDVVNVLSKEKVVEFLNRYLDLPNYNLTNYDYKTELQKYPVVNEKLEIEALHYSQVSGKRFFVTPNVMSRSTFKPAPDSNRKFPIHFDNEYRDIDTAVIEIPIGYKPESMPKQQEIQTEFGKYRSAIVVEENKIIYTRMLEKYSGTFAASKYGDMVKFWDQVYKADRAKIVMVKATE